MAGPPSSHSSSASPPPMFEIASPGLAEDCYRDTPLHVPCSLNVETLNGRIFHDAPASSVAATEGSVLSSPRSASSSYILSVSDGLGRKCMSASKGNMSEKDSMDIGRLCLSPRAEVGESMMLDGDRFASVRGCSANICGDSPMRGSAAFYMNPSDGFPPKLNQHEGGASCMAESMGIRDSDLFVVEVSGSDLKFNCAHFIAHRGFRERIHGHNYSVSIKLQGTIRDDGYVMDFREIKRATRLVCKSLNEYFIVPMKSDVLVITKENDSILIRCECGSEFKFPKMDCACLPLVHSSAEELAMYIWGRIVFESSSEYLLGRGVSCMEVTVAESPTQCARFMRQLKWC